LANLKFTGDVWAIPEGTVFFANEPILRIKAPIIQAQLVETALLNIINLSTMIATKASRVVYFAGDRKVYDFSLRRTHGFDAGLRAARSSYIAGCMGTSNLLAGMVYKIPVVGTMAHSFVMAFESEIAAFKAFTQTFPENSILLIDTYNNLKGIENAMRVARDLKIKGYRLKSVRIDSGDLVKISREIRRILNNNGFRDVEILASGNLDEYKIARLIKSGAAIDSFGVGTNMGTSCDMPFCDVIYKISEVSSGTGEFLPTMKLSTAKTTYPGRKQIFRQLDGSGSFKRDIIGLESENINSNPLLFKVMLKGRSIYNQPALDDIRRFAIDSIGRLPARYKRLTNASRYPVEISPGLKRLTKRLGKELRKRS
jgi:nicotinate phosphoribosyltransferase